MPCSDGGPTREETERELRDHQTMTRLACDRCRELEKRSGKVPAWASEWWEAHKLEDRQRFEQEERARDGSRIRERAVAKLTPEERAELGV